MANHVVVYPRPGSTIYLAGGVHGFTAGPVPVSAEHAAALAAHVTPDPPPALPAPARTEPDEPG